jgi:hypothetical protein
MKCRLVRSSAALLALVVCLAVGPVAGAQRLRDERDFGEKVVRFLQKLVRGITTFSDIPVPPKP